MNDTKTGAYTFRILELVLQWLAEKLDFLAVFDLNWRYFEGELHTLKVLLCCFLSYVHIGRYDFGLSNELLIIIIAQEAAKL